MGIKWFLSWILIFPVLKILTGIEIYGSIPKRGAVILACNHVSFIDPPLVGITACREVYFLAKAGLFNLSKFFTWLITTYNALNVFTTEGMKKAIRLLKGGNVVVIFPEGTRSKKGLLLPFNPGIGYLSITLNVPVTPVRIINNNKKFISLMLRINKLKIIFGKPIYPIGYKKDRKDFERFATKVREAITKLR
jgi:1-acyl-sn-glycerol-3-phosphate acyltransferase